MAGRSVFQDVGTDQKQHPVTPGGIENPATVGRTAVAQWLWGLVGLIILMIIIGGLTRLTDSGLSITQWDPVMGAIPPLNTTDWDAAFDLYKTTSEWALQNSLMTMAEFKVIYWWEWGHRQLGRFIGLYWFMGFAIFYAMGRIPRPRVLPLFMIGPFIGVQGLIGWVMVHSGLQGTRIDVASYWLMTHLGAAFALLGYVVWQAQILGRSEADLIQARRAREGIFGLSTGLMYFVFVQILLGALVAGIDAGRNYTDWPLMAGGFLPPDIFALDPWWRNFFEDDGLVQFIHRMTAYALFVFGLYVGFKGAKSPNKATRKAFGRVGLLLILQMVIGVVTVMHSAPLHWAILHQFFGVLLWVAVIRGRFLVGYPLVSSVRG
ncbi:MAG: COX15/CtaA family protein [Pseudomonadota bacterium]